MPRKKKNQGGKPNPQANANPKPSGSAEPAAASPPPGVASPAKNSPAKKSPASQIKQPLPSNTKLAVRPQRSPLGTPILCTVNHFLVKIQVDCIYQYHINVTPEIESFSARRRLLATCSNNVLGTQYIFDGNTILFSTKLIEDQDLTSTLRQNEYTISIQMTRNINLQSIDAQVYNVLSKRILQSLGLTAMGRQYFDASKPLKIPKYKLELWPGFFTSIGSTISGAALCCDIAHKIVRTDSVLELLNEVKDQRRFATMMDGQIVLTRYNNRTYRVDGIEWKKNPLSSFETKQGTSTFVQYYQTHHHITITDRKQPLLRIVDRRTKEMIFLVPELSYLTGITDQMRNDFNVMKELDSHTKVSPKDRHVKLKNFTQSINASKEVQNHMSEWNLKFQTEPMKIKGIKLATETVDVGGRPLSAGPKAEWNNKSIVAPMNIAKSLFIYPSRISREADTLMEKLDFYARQFKIQFTQPKSIMIGQDKPDLFVKAIEENVTEQTDMIICLLERRGSYDAIKVKCCKQLGIPSQCVMAKSMKNPKRVASICSKIIQQINCKVGGELWKVSIPISDTMVVGIDVCHDTLSDKGRGKRSVVGFTATTNKAFTKYFSTVKFQGVGQEIVDELGECFDEAMENWKELNNTYPKDVIVYRDGVGEGQFRQVLEYEVPQIKRVLEQKSAGIRLTTVVVQKRIHTRIFDHTKNPRQPENAPPGSVIDTGCVSNDSYDFYMVSQHVLVGTATPTHYRIIHDEICLTTGQLQVLTYKLCHLYYNWAGTIRVPAPCHYAHKIAFLIGKSVHSTPHENLNNLLHYL